VIVLDTDTLTLLLSNHARVLERRRDVSDAVVLTIISRVEILQGRFAALLKAADGPGLQQAQGRLEQT